jgi:hypothetical protein
MTPRRLALVVLAVALPLAGCGKMGELQRPAPMFGNKSAARAPVREPAPPVATVDRRDLNTDPVLPDLPAPQNSAAEPQ